MNKYILITSDDFGVCHSINQGVLKGFRDGLLSSSNLMATTPWFPEAARIVKENDLPVGVHLTLTCEWTNVKHGPLTMGKSLKDDQGYFYASYEELFNSMDLDEIRMEYIAQIDKVLACGIKPTHVETHMIPPRIDNTYSKNYHKILDVVREVADQYGLMFTYDTKNNKHVYFDDVFELTQESYSQLLSFLKSKDSGIYHIICHCGIDSEEIRNIATVYDPVYIWGAAARQKDLDIITSDGFRRFLDSEGFKIIGIKELQELIN